MALMACRVGIIAAALFGAGSLMACAGSSANAPSSATGASADEATAGLMEHHRFHHHGGVTLFIAMSIDTLGVPPEKKAAVEKIRSELYARMEPASTAEQNLMTVLANGVASAKLDPATVDAAVAQVMATAASVHDASADALNELHAVLSPPERGALVDKVESHWAIWQRVNADDLGATQRDDGHLARLVVDLGLTSSQIDQVRAGLGGNAKAPARLDPLEVAAHLRAFGDAFRSEKFDAHAFTAAGGVNGRVAGWGAAHLAQLIEAVSPVLTADQRATLAERLREHATHDLTTQANR
jgi:hypothetical protein